MSPPRQIVPPPRRRSFDPAEDFYTRQTASRREQDANDRWRIMLATAVVCTGISVAGIALWQAQNARTVYVPIPSEPTAPAVVTLSAPAVYRVPVTAPETVSSRPMVPARAAAPAMPLTWTPAPAYPVPTPVDYAARDRQIADLKSRMEKIDETIRRVRADPHWYGLVKGSTDTSRQQSSDAYLADLDRQRNELRRQKWALEGR